MKLYEIIKSYTPKNTQEEKDKEAFLRFLESDALHFNRDNLGGHITVSAWIVNSEKTKVLFCYHNIYNSWSWVGGHADGEEDLLSVAVKEAYEETGVSVKSIYDGIFSLEILPVSGHMRKGSYVPSHIHYNITYLVEADESAALKNKPDENSAVMWIPTDKIAEYSTEEWMVKNIYSKMDPYTVNEIR